MLADFSAPCWSYSPRTQVARTKRYRERGLEPTKPELIAYARRGASADLRFFFLLLFLCINIITIMMMIIITIIIMYCIVNNHDWLTMMNHD